MARYRKVDPRIWNDAKFRTLSDDGKLIFLFLLTHPQMTSLGAMRGTINGLAAEIGWDQKRFAKGFQEALSKAMAKHDPEASFLWLPKFLKYNGPESPNVLKAWAGALDLLPECPLLNELLEHVKGFAEGLTEGFREAYAHAWPKAMPNPEQEPEQEPEQNKNILSDADASDDVDVSKPARKKPPYTQEFAAFWSAYPKKVGKDAAWRAWRNRNGTRPELSVMLSAIEQQRQTDQWQRDNGQYIPNPATWLNQGRWGDETAQAYDPYAAFVAEEVTQ
jgi:hypothetical protein